MGGIANKAKIAVATALVVTMFATTTYIGIDNYRNPQRIKERQERAIRTLAPPKPFKICNPECEELMKWKQDELTKFRHEYHRLVKLENNFLESLSPDDEKAYLDEMNSLIQYSIKYDSLYNLDHRYKINVWKEKKDGPPHTYLIRSHPSFQDGRFNPQQICHDIKIIEPLISEAGKRYFSIKGVSENAPSLGAEFENTKVRLSQIYGTGFVEEVCNYLKKDWKKMVEKNSPPPHMGNGGGIVFFAFVIVLSIAAGVLKLLSLAGAGGPPSGMEEQATMHRRDQEQ